MEMKRYKLGEIGEIRMCKRILKEETNSVGGVPFFKIGTFGGQADVFITKEKFDEYKNAYSYPKKGDVLISAAGTIGRTVVFDGKDAYFQDSNIVWIENDESKVLNEYLFYCYKNIHWTTSVGSTILRLYNDDIRNTDIIVPPLSDQKKIASVLSALDDKIALNKKMNQKLEAMAKRLYDYWFVQYDFPDKNGHPYKTTGGPMTYNPTLKREIPEGWTDGVLSDIANITMGQSPDGSSYNENGEGMIFYQGSTDFGMRFPTVRQYTTAPTRFARKGDILMSVRAPVGAVNIANTDCCIGRGLSALNSKLGSLSHLYFLIDVFKKTFENKNTVGTTFGSITKDELYALPVVIPDKNVIEQFEKMAMPIFDRQMKLGEESNRLTALRDKLLPLLMNGQVTIK